MKIKTEDEILDEARKLKSQIVLRKNDLYRRDADFNFIAFPSMMNTMTVMNGARNFVMTEHPFFQPFYILPILYGYQYCCYFQNDLENNIYSTTALFFTDVRRFDQILTNFHVPERFFHPIKLTSLSLIQAYYYFHISKAQTTSNFEKILKYALIVGNNFICDAINEKVASNHSIYIHIPVKILTSALFGSINFILASKSFPAIKQSIRTYIGKMLFFKDKIEEFPENLDVPEELQCTICRSLLNNPMILGCNFYCKDCINHWLNENEVDPADGLPATKRSLYPSPEMKHFCCQYYKLKIANTNQ